MKNYLAVKMLLVAVLVPCAALLRCANPNSGGTETGDSKIASMLYNPGGSPAVSAKVYFRHHDNDPRPGFDSGVVDSTTTDANGNYSVTLDPGTYTIEASGDSGLAYVDSVTVINDSTVRPDPDTLKPAGTIRGVVRLEEGGDPTTIFILFMGTRTFTWPDDTFGNFSSGAMAEGDYRVKILTTTPDYEVMDTSFTITAGLDAVLPDTLRLRYTGIPVPRGLQIQYDTMKQIVTLVWNTPTTGRPVQSYDIYRKNVDSNTVLARLNASPVTDTVYVDSTGVQDMTYEYQVAVVDTSASEGVKSAGVSVRVIAVFVLQDTLVITNGELTNAARDKYGNYYCFNYTQKKVQVFDTSGLLKREWSIFNNTALSTLKWKKTIAIDESSNVYVANNGQVFKYDSLGNFIDTTYFYTQSANQITALSFFKDTLFFSEFIDRKVHAITTDGDTLFTINHNWQAGDKLRSLACDSVGNIYLYCEVQGSDRIQVFDKTGQYMNEIPAAYGDVNIFISADYMLLAGYEKVTCLSLGGALIFQYSVPSPNPYQSPVCSFLVNGGQGMVIGFLEGYIALYARQ